MLCLQKQISTIVLDMKDPWDFLTLCFVSIGKSKGGARDTPPPRGPNYFNFMPPSPVGGCSHPGEILDPPLISKSTSFNLPCLLERFNKYLMIFTLLPSYKKIHNHCIKSSLWIRHCEMRFCFCTVKLADVIHTMWWWHQAFSVKFFHRAMLSLPHRSEFWTSWFSISWSK